ncbi:hypothetical protein [Tenacibaculum sp. SG-28]|uniref:hypothetical protein n=1 Tax=Tenacibaculum sp. SG-28 TaxID=754426 RepID=UPI000CF4DC81|nr:hypothetical protein [Tenacibaculum sp. SG-28]PQJ20716.1 hypothetical protein BSU00_10505 [Tenacibaculum sp. SG-28]
MKNLGILMLSVFMMVSCNTNGKKDSEIKVSEETTPTEKSIVGNDKDEHGCIGSAGYTWSELRQECIRTFEVGVRLNPVESNEDSTIISAFVVFNDAKSKAELFLPEAKGTMIMEQSEGKTFIKDQYTFNPEDATLSVNGEVTYKGAE